MTVQAQDIIEYRNQEYRLIGAPLNSFLDNRKDIRFENYSSANWQGYQGIWQLKEDKLYIIDLVSSNHKYDEIFKTNEPVLASWFSGSIEFGFGNYYPDHWWGYYDDYLLLNIERGIIKERQIIKRILPSPRFDFGKYKGREIIDVINGKIHNNVYTTFKNYLEGLLEYICNKNFDQKYLVPHFAIDEKDIELVKDIRKYGVHNFITQTYIAVSSKCFWENSDKDEIAEKLATLLEKIFASDFNAAFTLSKKGLENALVFESSVLINPDLNYINWAIKNVEFFTIPPSLLNTSFSLKKIKKININRINPTILEYRILIDDFNYEFSHSIKDTNQKKFENKYHLRYNAVKDFYTHNLPEPELLKRFGFYLNEKYEIPMQREDCANNRDDYYERQTYGEYAGTYAQDVEGLSDEFIGTVLDGDPDAYWNID